MPKECDTPDWNSRVTQPGLSRLPSGFSMNHLELYGMDEEERRQRQGFLGIKAEDAVNVRALRNVFADYSRQFAQRFYDHLLANPHTAALLQDAKQLEILKGLQAKYFAELLEGVY